MDRLLLLVTTTTYRAGAFLEAASRLGVPVVVGSDRPQILASANPAGSLALNFLAPEDGTRSIVEFARRFPIGAVIAADDDGVVLAAMTSAALGLPHNPVEAVSAARDKFRMRGLLTRSGIPSPRFQRIATSEDPEAAACHVSYPCVLKPLSLSGSRGVIRADGPAEFVTAFTRIGGILRRPEVAAHAGQLAEWILVEDFVPGIEVAVEGLVSQGSLRTLAIFDKPDPLDGPFFEETIYVTPSRLPAAAQERIAACTAEALRALGIQHGPVHAELRLNEDGAWIIEIAPRSIGGLCSRTLRFGDGASLEELILRHALRLPVDAFEREGLAAGVMMIPIPRAGILQEVRGVAEAEQTPGIEEIRLTIPPGQALVPVPEGTRYLGFIFARGESPDLVEASLRQAHRRLVFAITPLEDTQTEAHPLSATQRGGTRHRPAVQAGGSRRLH